MSSTTLSEAASKELLAAYGIPFLVEVLATTPDAAIDAAVRFDRPVAIKLCGANIAHKTERGLVRLGVSGAQDVGRAATELLAASTPADEATGVLVAPMADGSREFIAGATIDPVFGPTVVIGIGGILAEAIADVSIRLAPIDRIDAMEMIDDLRTSSLLGEFRGEPPVDRRALAGVILSLSRAITEIEGIVAIDLNPVRIVDGSPIALDALVEIEGGRR